MQNQKLPLILINVRLYKEKKESEYICTTKEQKNNPLNYEDTC